MGKKPKLDIKKRQVVTPEFRAAFAEVFQPKAFGEGKPKYSVVMLFDKKTDLTALKKAAFYVASAEYGPDKKKWPKNFRMPFRDGDEKQDLAGYKGKIFITASSMERPGIVDKDKQQIHESDGTFYSGCFARAQINAFTYDAKGNKGVSFGLQNLQKVKDGDRFSGRQNPEDVFETIEDGSDAEESYDDSDVEEFEDAEEEYSLD